MAAIALALFPASPAYAERVELEPASPWNVNYAENSCELRRVYEHDGKQAFLYLRQYGPAHIYEIIAGSSDFSFLHTPTRMPRRNSGSKQRDVYAMWEPDGTLTQIKSPMFIELADGGRALVFVGNIETASVADVIELTGSQALEVPQGKEELRHSREKEITGFLLEGVFYDNLYFRTGSLQGPMEAMRACTDDLVGHWGLDVDVQRKLSRRAKPLDIKVWARELQRRYPVNMVRDGRQATLVTFLLISAEGRVTNCRVLNEYNKRAFEEVACRALEDYGRFEPALDEHGNPVESFYITTLAYRIG